MQGAEFGSGPYSATQIFTHEFGHNFTGPLVFNPDTGLYDKATFNGNRHVYDFEGDGTIGDRQRMNNAQQTVSGFGTLVGGGDPTDDSETTADAFANWVQGTIANEYQNTVDSWMSGIMNQP